METTEGDYKGEAPQTKKREPLPSGEMEPHHGERGSGKGRKNSPKGDDYCHVILLYPPTHGSQQASTNCQ